MRFFSILFLCIISIACSFTTSKNNALIHFTEQEYNFGSLPLKKETQCLFEFTNPGKSMLLIYDVKTSCGCTVPEWTKKPVKPGGKGEIKIKYDSAFPGVFHKTISVYFNGEDSPATLHIKGQVEYPDDLTENIK